MQAFDFGRRLSETGGPDSFYTPAPYGAYDVHGYVAQDSYFESEPGPSIESNVIYTDISKNGPRKHAANSRGHAKSAGLLNVNDPVAMHLLMETAMVDSKEFAVLSYEELEDLKRGRVVLLSKIDATRRKVALETKLKDAAQSLNRLYSTKGRRESSDFSTDRSPRKQRRSLLGRDHNGSIDTLRQTDDELAASQRKLEDLAKELEDLQMRHEDIQRQILEHTAGVLQMTHRGLKKNLRPEDLPRSPESMSEINHRSMPMYGGIEDFDERSWYRSTDYDDPSALTSKFALAQTHALEDTEKQLQTLITRLHEMVTSVEPSNRLHPPVLVKESDIAVLQPGTHIEAQLGYVANSLDVIEQAQARQIQDAERSMFDSEHQLDGMNSRLNGILEKTASVGQSPTSTSAKDSDRKSMASQFAFSTMVLDRLDTRIENLVQQKDILTRQIQQQRELNSKSDAQRDAKIMELSDELAEANRLHSVTDSEVRAGHDQINLLMEQFDSARQEAVLVEQQRNMDGTKALQIEKEARREVEESLFAQIKAHQDQNVTLQSSLATLKKEHDVRGQEYELRIQKFSKDMDDLTRSKGEVTSELQRCQIEMQHLESEMIRAQTDLVVARAELDGAYGSRAQRAADVSMNPAIQKELDDLNDSNSALQREINFLKDQQDSTGPANAEVSAKVEMLQRELKETIEDYEVMTRASIEFEKERDELESVIDTLREKHDAAEAQLSDEKVKWLGVKSSGAGGSIENTSTMVLKNEFKKMMRDTRMENMKVLKVISDKG